MFNKDNLHHGYLIEGEHDSLLNIIHTFLTDELSFSIQGNPDYAYEQFITFGIDDARSLGERQLRVPAQGEKKVFVLAFNTMTREAQNSLLKVFEEPTAGTHFFLITPSISTMLPTLRSRLRIIERFEVGGEDTISKEAKTFFTGSIKERMKIVKNIVESDTAKADAFALLSALESLVQTKIEKKDTKYLKSAEEILKMRSYLEDTAPSVKMILEHLALILP